MRFKVGDKVLIFYYKNILKGIIINIMEAPLPYKAILKDDYYYSDTPLHFSEDEIILDNEISRILYL